MVQARITSDKSDYCWRKKEVMESRGYGVKHKGLGCMSSRVLYARYYKIDLFSNLSLYRNYRDI